MSKESKTARAEAKYIKVSPLKARKVMNVVRDVSINKAIAILQNLPHKSAELILKVLNSAISNGENNHQMDRGKMIISKMIANEAPLIKRHKFRARGRIDNTVKRSSHLVVEIKES